MQNLLNFFPPIFFSCFALNTFSFSQHLNFAKSFPILISFRCFMWHFTVSQYYFDRSRQNDCTLLKIASSITTPILFSFLISGLLACNSKENRVNIWSSFAKWNKTGPKKTGWCPESSDYSLVLVTRVSYPDVAKIIPGINTKNWNILICAAKFYNLFNLSLHGKVKDITAFFNNDNLDNIHWFQIS